MSANSEIVSTETAIAIAFGLLSAIISLVAISIGYMTFRVMTFETCTYASISSYLTSAIILYIMADYCDDLPSGKYHNNNILPYGHVLRHEHTYLRGIRDKRGGGESNTFDIGT